VLPSLILESIITQISIYQKKSAFLVKLVSLKSISNFGIGIILLLSFKNLGYLALLLSELVTSIWFSIFVVFKLSSFFKLEFSKKHLKYILAYSLPLIPYMLSLTLLSQSDRIFIDNYFGKEDVGLYSLVYNSGMISTMLLAALLNSANPKYFENLNKGNFNAVKAQSNRLFVIAVLISLSLVLFGSDILSIVVDSKYSSALNLIPIIAVSGLCSAVFQIYVRTFSYLNKTYIIAIIATSSTAINFLLNIYLLPLYSYKFAAISTLIAYLFMAATTMHLSNRYLEEIKESVINKIGVILLFFIISVALTFATISSSATLLLKIGIFLAIAYLFRNEMRELFGTRKKMQ
jgi:O-antigen/teichoic acid export membrane protein